MRCPSCNKYSDSYIARFCQHCGQPLNKRCMSCGALVSPGANYCPSCGRSLTGGQPAWPEPTRIYMNEPEKGDDPLTFGLGK